MCFLTALDFKRVWCIVMINVISSAGKTGLLERWGWGLDRKSLLCIWSKYKPCHGRHEKYKVIEFTSLAAPCHVLLKNNSPGWYQMHTNNKISPPWWHYNINRVSCAEEKKVIKEKVTAARGIEQIFTGISDVGCKTKPHSIFCLWFSSQIPLR